MTRLVITAAGIQYVTYVSTNIGRSCEHCGYEIGYSTGRHDLADSINHYIQKHGYKLLHVGTETSHDDHGKPWHSTDAVLGSMDVPPMMPTPGRIEIVVSGRESEAE